MLVYVEKNMNFVLFIVSLRAYINYNNVDKLRLIVKCYRSHLIPACLYLKNGWSKADKKNSHPNVNYDPTPNPQKFGSRGWF